jgi:DNA mismatch repair protein MSH2
MGSFVPASAMEFTPFDAVCARVGAGDHAVKGVSTFMAEMLEAGTILATATPASLVIIDELGRGTSTYDGFGLASAISEHLALRARCFTLFATHFHEITALEDELPRGVARNYHVSAATSGSGSEGVITFLYALRPGPCPSSFGIAVARLAAFPPEVIAMATQRAAKLEATSGIILSSLRQKAMGKALAAGVKTISAPHGGE